VGNDTDAWRGGRQDAVWAGNVPWTLYADCSMGIMWPRKKDVRIAGFDTQKGI